MTTLLPSNQPLSPWSSQTLREDLETKLYGNFEGICIALGSSLTDYLAADLHRLMACSDNDPDSVVEVLLGTSKSDMSKVKSAYENGNNNMLHQIWCDRHLIIRHSLRPAGDGVTLEADIESKYSGSVQKLLAQLSDVSIRNVSNRITFSIYDCSIMIPFFFSIQGKGQFDVGDQLLCQTRRRQFVQRRLVDGDKWLLRWIYYYIISMAIISGQATINGTDEDLFIDIFAKRGYNHLNAIYEQYEAQYGDTMESVIQSEFDGDMERLMLDISK